MSAVVDDPRSYAPRTGAWVAAPPETPAREVDAAVARAEAAAPGMAALAPAVRQGWLARIADALLGSADELIELADEETALGRDRLGGELARASAALRFYGSAAAEGSWLDATIDRGPGLDLRRSNRPLGPVAVFGASNFPFGFGVLGHDAGSALAAGCPVAVKAHPAHPRLSRRLGEVAADALESAGAPRGAFALVHGFEAGIRLVTHPATRAVGFTGSQGGGLALWRLANQRAVPIPVYAEMGTVNSVVVTRAAAAERGPVIAAGFVGSFSLGAGQFCTKPGLLLVPAGSGLCDVVAAELERQAPRGWLLTRGIAEACAEGVQRLVRAGATVLTTVSGPPSGWSMPTTLAVAPSSALHTGSPLLDECFGPVALVVEYEPDELPDILAALPGSLAAGVQAGSDDPDVAALVETLAARCGRVLVDDWPTGVAVTWAQHHGGPWPATSTPWATSVGAAALRRFVRPVAFQNVPDTALPAELRDENPWSLPRRVNGAVPA